MMTMASDSDNNAVLTAENERFDLRAAQEESATVASFAARSQHLRAVCEARNVHRANND